MRVVRFMGWSRVGWGTVRESAVQLRRSAWRGVSLAESARMHAIIVGRTNPLKGLLTHVHTTVSPRHHPKPRTYVHVKYALLCFRHGVLRRSNVFLALSGAGQARGPSAHYDACLDPSRAPWRCFEHSTSLNWLFWSRGVALPRSDEQVHVKYYILFIVFSSLLPSHRLVFIPLSRPLYNISPIVFTFSAVCYAAAFL